jgi:pyruvate formate lyase activating enzyme
MKENNRNGMIECFLVEWIQHRILFFKKMISGLQKFSSVDYPGKLACTFFFGGCNMRCKFCHNCDLVTRPKKMMSEDEALLFLESHKSFLDGVCMCGGEAMMSLTSSFLQKIKQLGLSIKIDTNGTFPQKLKSFIEQGLVDYVAMDVKAIQTKYKDLAPGRYNIKDLEKSIKIISILPKYEFRTTVIPNHHTINDIHLIRDWLLQISGTPKLRAMYLQQFVARPSQMIDTSFEKLPSTDLSLLAEMAQSIKDSFDICEVRH